MTGGIAPADPEALRQQGSLLRPFAFEWPKPARLLRGEAPLLQLLGEPMRPKWPQKALSLDAFEAEAASGSWQGTDGPRGSDARASGLFLQQAPRAPRKPCDRLSAQNRRKGKWQSQVRNRHTQGGSCGDDRGPCC